MNPRGRNFFLHNLQENDVVFGTKGNGRNEIFLKVLESNSLRYMQLSKFEKMGLIQKIIRDWKGNFYIMNSKTNDLCLAKRKDHELSNSDPNSRKLYTSVRRMMNYVNSKNQRQSYHPQQSESSNTSIPIIRTFTTQSTVSTEQESKKTAFVSRAEISNLAVQQQKPAMLTTVDYISKNQDTLPLDDGPIMDFSRAQTCTNISSPQPSAFVVTPEPSPRFTLLQPPPITPLPLSKSTLSKEKTLLIVPSFPLTPVSSSTVACEISTEKSCLSTPISTARNAEFTRYLHASDNNIGDLEESAILALTSLGNSSSIRSFLGLGLARPPPKYHNSYNPYFLNLP